MSSVTARAALFAVAATALATTTHAGAPPYVKIPASAPAPGMARIPDREPKEIDRAFGSPVASHITVTGGRGSLAVGLLFGPLGVAANMAKAKAQNEDRAKPLGDLTAIDVVQALRDIRPAAASVAAGAPAYELVPSLSYEFTDDTTFRVHCQLSATFAGTGNKPWRALYSVRQYDLFTSTDAASRTRARAIITPCLIEANRLFDVHTAGGLLPGETLHDVVLNGKTTPMKLVESEYPDRVILPWVLGYTQHVPPHPPHVEPPAIVEPEPVAVPDAVSEAH